MKAPPSLTKLSGRPQLIISKAEDLKRLLELPPQYWMVNSIPVTGLSGQAKLLQSLDTNSNKRITPCNILEAIRDLEQGLTDLSGCIQQSSSILLANLNQTTPVGQALLTIAQTALQLLGEPERLDITTTLVHRLRTQIEAAPVNGDGIIPLVAAQNEEEQKLLELGMQIHGAISDRNGRKGIHFATIQPLRSQIQGWRAWKEHRPTSSLTNAMVQIIHQIQPWIDQHFIAQHQPDVHFDTPMLTSTALQGSLRPTIWVHPNARDAWQALWEQVCQPLQIEEISWPTWEGLLAQSNALSSWSNAKPSGNFNAISESELAYWEANTANFQKGIDGLETIMQADLATANQLKALHKLERIILLQEKIVPFLNSTINFSAFYDPTQISLPELGSLLMDGRIFRLSVYVGDIAKHKAQAQHSGFCLLYTRVEADTPFVIAAAVTGNTRGDLHIGKKGVFVDLNHNEYPAEIIDLVDAPITVLEAFLEPLGLLKSQLKQLTEKIAVQQQQQIQTTPPVSSQVMMTGGVTLAALSSSLAYVTKTIVSINLQSMLLVLIAPMLILGLVSSIRAGWKLVRRDLGPVLEASGWGINHPVPAPEWAANVFTHEPEYKNYPITGTTDLLHTFEKVVEPRRPFKKLLAWSIWILLLIVLWFQWDSVMLLWSTLPMEQ